MLVVRLRIDTAPEKHATFEKPEISIGRDPGNDIAVPDASVSKFHTLIAKTNAGVVLTDLRSTNGTYVNGGRIAGTVGVGEFDEITIGGASLFVKAGAGAWQSGPERAIAPAPAAPAAAAAPATAAALAAPTVRTRVPSAALESAPPKPQVAEPTSPPTRRRRKKSEAGGDDSPSSERDVVAAEPPAPKQAKAKVAAATPRAAAGGASTIPPDATLDLEDLFPHMVALIERVGKAINLAAYSTPTLPLAEAMKKLDVVLAAQVPELRLRPDLAARVVETVRREYAGLGAIEPWMDDAKVTEIQCLRYDQIELRRDGEFSRAPVAYSSSTALQRAMRRLAKQSGTDWTTGEEIVERRFPDGAQLIALVPPLASSLCMTIRKREAVRRTLDSLVKLHALSERMAAFLTRCMASRANILVCGEAESAVAEMIAAITGSAPANHRVMTMHSGAEIQGGTRSTLHYPLPLNDEEQALRRAVSFGYEHLVVTSTRTKAAAAAVISATAGASGVVTGFTARTLERGIMHIAGQLMLARVGLGPHAVNSIIADGVDVAIAVSRTEEGRLRVLRISELELRPQGVAPRDLFTMTRAEGKESVFAATGTAARVDFVD